MNRGFTYMEIVIVVVILGVLSTIAIPKIVGPAEQVTSQEARQTLMALLAAQNAYRLETGGYTNVLGNLDVTFPASTYFNAPTVATATPLAAVGRTGGAYTLSISDTGIITCAVSGSAGCVAAHCNKNPGGNRCN